MVVGLFLPQTVGAFSLSQRRVKQKKLSLPIGMESFHVFNQCKVFYSRCLTLESPVKCWCTMVALPW